MQSPIRTALPRPLGGGLWLRRAASTAELENVVQSHAAGFGDDDDPVVLRSNLCARPGSSPADVLYVADEASGSTVSSVSLIRQTWTYEGVPFPVGEVGIVSTRPEYRKRGLVRAQFDAYERLARQAGCVMSVIAGIPYFYRQFGYDYMLPMDGGVELRPEQIPDLAEGEASSMTLRPARETEMPTLQAFYRHAMADFGVATALSPAIWRYQDGLPEACSDRRMTLMMERNVAPVGYMRMMANENDDWYKGAAIMESYLPDHESCLAALRHAKAMALNERKVATVRIRVPVSMPLVDLARDLGGETRHAYAWQVKLIDPVGFLLTVRPALERRLAESPWRGLTRDLFVGWYRRSVVLRFREGQLYDVAALSKVERHDLRCPPNAMAMIWLGHRSVKEVQDWYPDAGCRDRATARLMDALFPKRPSWVVTLF